ncbi:MAG: ABC transporter substrate-binding protein [Dehalococcoidia bacterium]
MIRLFSRLVVLLTVVGMACAPSAPGGSVPVPEAKPAVPQRFVWGSASFVPTLHPFISIQGSQRRFDIYDTVLAQNADGSVGPAVATSWRTVDPLTWEFKIRQDLRFHDGVAMTAEDVKFSIERANDPAKKYAISGRLGTFGQTTIVDPTTVRVGTKTPDPLFPKRIMLISILPKAYLERVGDDGFQNAPIGTGPFRVAEWKEQGHLTVVAMPEHPYRKATLTQATIRFIPEPSARQAGLRTGDLDYADAIPLEQGPAFQSAGFKLLAYDSGSSAGYTMDTVILDQPTPLPTRDKRVRQAINYAVDKDSIAKNIYRGYTKPEQCQLVQPETFGFNPRLKPYPYDPAKAKQLLAAAGYPNGFKLELRGQRTSAEAEPLALFVQSQLKDVGIEVEYQVIDPSTYRDLFYGDRTRPGLFVHGLTNRPAFDADFALTWFSGTNVGGTRHYDNAEFDRAYLASQQEMNEARRLELLQKALEIFCEDPPYLFLVQLASMAVHQASVDGIERRADNSPDLSKIKRT